MKKILLILIFFYDFAFSFEAFTIYEITDSASTNYYFSLLLSYFVLAVVVKYILIAIFHFVGTVR